MALKLKIEKTYEDTAENVYDNAYAICNLIYTINRTSKLIVFEVKIYKNKAAYNKGKSAFVAINYTPSVEEFDLYFLTGNPFNKVDDFLLAQVEWVDWEID